MRIINAIFSCKAFKAQTSSKYSSLSSPLGYICHATYSNQAVTVHVSLALSVAVKYNA